MNDRNSTATERGACSYHNLDWSVDDAVVISCLIAVFILAFLI